MKTSTPGLDQLLVALDRQPRAPGGVLGVADDQAEPPAVDQPGQDLADDLPAGRADDVADEQDLEGHGGLAFGSGPEALPDSRPRTPGSCRPG